MAIALPTWPAPSGAEPWLVDFGGELVPFLGGPVQRINRLGTRLGLRVTMPPMRGDVARQFQTRLLRAKFDRALLEWPLLDLDPGAPPNPQINATSSGTAVSVKGLGAGYQVVEGQPLSIIHGGRRYVHLATGPVVANGAGVAAIGVFPPSRVTYSVNDTVEIVTPIIEGLVSPGDELGWSLAVEHTMGFAFSVVESK